MNCRLLVLMKRRPPAPPLFPYRRSSDLEQAQAEADVLLWDGGNNDLPFYLPDVHIALVDPLRVGHETRYHPGEANLRRAHVRSEEHTSELQSQSNLVCRLLLEKKNNMYQ